jgi:hypothetical protein
MLDKDIYKLWFSKTDDRRFLRPKRWNALKNFILATNSHKILEFGSGVSTLLMSNLGLNIHTYETDPAYISFVKSFNFPNITFHLWDNNSDPITDLFDLSLVDGVNPRDEQLKRSITLSRYIAVDDYVGCTARALSPTLTNLSHIPTDSFISFFVPPEEYEKIVQKLNEFGA